MEFLSQPGNWKPCRSWTHINRIKLKHFHSFTWTIRVGLAIFPQRFLSGWLPRCRCRFAFVAVVLGICRGLLLLHFTSLSLTKYGTMRKKRNCVSLTETSNPNEKATKYVFLVRSVAVVVRVPVPVPDPPHVCDLC